jgi:hypothetical protein
MIQSRVARSFLVRFGSSALLQAVLLASLLAGRARASLVMALDTNELTKRADHIAVADVISVESAWDDRHQKIHTTIELAVVESWKGGALPASHLTIVQPGGTVGDIAMVVFGLSQFVTGERTLLFLRGKTTAAGVVGMAQGKRPMRRDASTGQWMIDRADQTGLGRVALRPATAGATTPVPTPTIPATTPSTSPSIMDDADGPRSLDDMRIRVRQILKAKP